MAHKQTVLAVQGDRMSGEEVRTANSMSQLYFIPQQTGCLSFGCMMYTQTNAMSVS